MMGPMGGDGELAAGAAAGCSYALLADGTTITIRPARPGDYTAVRQLHEAMSPANQYLRFFSLSRLAAEQEASLRGQIAATQDITAVAKMNDGSFYMVSKQVKVTIGGCGG